MGNFYTFVKTIKKQEVILKILDCEYLKQAIPRILWRSAILCVSQVEMPEIFQKNGKNFPKFVLVLKSGFFRLNLHEPEPQNGG